MYEFGVQLSVVLAASKMRAAVSGRPAAPRRRRRNPSAPGVMGQREETASPARRSRCLRWCGGRRDAIALRE